MQLAKFLHYCVLLRIFLNDSQNRSIGWNMPVDVIDRAELCYIKTDMNSILTDFGLEK
jgi:hypothetical protein